MNNIETFQYCSHKMKEINMLKSDTLLIKANTGLGKTKACYDYINKNLHVNPKDRIIFISHRISQSSKICGDLPNFYFYKDKNKDLDQHKLLSVQLESLHHYKPNINTIPDLLILDESEELLKQIYGKTNDKNFSRNLDIFRWMLKFSKKVIALSADISELTVEALSHYRENIRLEINTKKNKEGVKAIIVDNKLEFIEMILNDIKNNKRIVIPTNSLRFANEVFQIIQSKYSDKIFGFYTSNTSQEEKNKHFSDVNKYWSKLDVLIYTPTCPSALSFERNHYHKVYGYYTDTSCDFWSSMQMNDRIRNLLDKEYVFCVKAFGGNIPSNISDIENYLRSCKDVSNIKIDTSKLKCDLTIDGQYDFVEKDFLYKTYIRVLQKQIQTRNNFKSLLEEFLTKKGYNMLIRKNIQDISSNSIKNLLEEAKIKIMNRESAYILHAKSITDNEFEELKRKVDNGRFLSNDELNSFTKKKLQFSYGGFIFTEIWQINKYNNNILLNQYRLNKNYALSGNFHQMVINEISKFKFMNKTEAEYVKSWEEISRLKMEKFLLQILGFSELLEKKVIFDSSFNKIRTTNLLKSFLELKHSTTGLKYSNFLSCLYKRRRIISTNKWTHRKSLNLINSIFSIRYGYKIRTLTNCYILEKLHQFGKEGNPKLPMNIKTTTKLRLIPKKYLKISECNNPSTKDSEKYLIVSF